MRGLACWLLLLVALGAGCSSRSAYVRSDADDDELVWAYNDGLRVVDGRNQPVAQGPHWEGLADRVSCVPGARVLAEAAEADGGLARTISWTGTGVLAAGLGVSLTLGFAGVLLALASGPGPLILGSVVLLGGSLISIGAASALWAWASHLSRTALPEAMDAVNLYNDSFLEEEGCRASRGTP
jgi:hypothetical protein